jgi:hypothetical protein
MGETETEREGGESGPAAARVLDLCPSWPDDYMTPLSCNNWNRNKYTYSAMRRHFSKKISKGLMVRRVNCSWCSPAVILVS